MTLVKVNNQIPKTFDGLLNEFFNELPSNLGKSVSRDSSAFPSVNIQEKPSAYHLQLAVPGFEKTDFNIKLENNLLSISAAKQEDVKDESAKSIRNEFAIKTFKRSFTVDDKIDSTNISAKYENGILLIQLPKKELEKAIVKEITIA